MNERPEQVQPSELKDCNCDVGLFAQLRGMVARGEVLRPDYQAQTAAETFTGAFHFQFVRGELRDGEWRGRMNPELQKLAAALEFTGRICALAEGGQIVEARLAEDYGRQ